MIRMLTTVGLLSAVAASAAKAGKVQVYIMMGQSNMLGEGHVAGTTNGTLQFAVQTEHKYPYLWDAATKAYAVSKTVRDVAIMGSGGATAKSALHHNEFLTVNTTLKSTIGPELGIGWALDALNVRVRVCACVCCVCTCEIARCADYSLHD